MTRHGVLESGARERWARKRGAPGNGAPEGGATRHGAPQSAARPAAALLGVALLGLAGCIPQPRMYSAAQAPSELAPRERLARWTGERFEEVSRGSIPPSHLYVLVHGWAPGWSGAVAEQPALRAWDARTPAGEPFQPWFDDLARALTDADPHAVVVVYSWLDDAASIPFFFAGRRVMAHTDLHGRWLADALDAAAAPGFHARHGRVHLIGHSYGARVAAVAARQLHARGRLPRQLTILDAPENAMTYLTGSQAGMYAPLREVPIGPGADEIFVENYISMMGQHLHTWAGLEAVVDVYLRPEMGSGEYRRRHSYPMAFYAASAASEVGLGWSRLLRRAPAPRPGCYEQRFGRMTVRPGCYGASLGPTPGPRADLPVGPFSF